MTQSLIIITRIVDIDVINRMANSTTHQCALNNTANIYLEGRDVPIARKKTKPNFHDCLHWLTTFIRHKMYCILDYNKSIDNSIKLINYYYYYSAL